MGLKSFFIRILRRPSMIDSINHKSINQSITNIEQPSIVEQQTESPQFTQIPMHKESLELGLAAGYAGKSLKGIEASLERLESQATTKDWFSNTFEDKTPELIETLKRHEENDQKRFEILFNTLKSSQTMAEGAAEAVKTSIFTAKTLESQLQPTPKMIELIRIAKEVGEISYKDLAQKLLIGEDALRGLLTNTIRRSKEIERFERDNKGWVRYRY